MNCNTTHYRANSSSVPGDPTEIQEPLKSLESIDREKLSEADQLNFDLFKRDLEEDLEGSKFKSEYLAISQLGGVQQDVSQTLSIMQQSTKAQFDDIISRMKGVPKLVDDTIALLAKGLESGITQPKVTLRDVPEQVRNQISDDPIKSAILQPFTTMRDSIEAADQEKLKKEAVEIYTGQIVPAYQKLYDYLTTTYIPACRESIAAIDLPDGKEWYAFNVRARTTTTRTPQEIHDIGLSEVKRIRAEMDKTIADSGFKGSFAEFTNFLRTDPKFYFDDAQTLLMAYRDIGKRIDPELIHLFGKLPRLPYGVVAVPSYAEKSQTTAYYMGGSLEAGRPGYFYANTFDLKSRPKWEMEALTLHEAVPGHHLQIALAQEMEAQPKFRRFGGYTAFVEGWGLYAESLGGEIGLYKDPYSKFGQLTYEIWRAIRLVVDTGMHSLGWSRQQAIDYFKENTGRADHDIVVEVDRYIVWPGQALAYKVGELKFKELRALAKSELGDSFDIRTFHDALLANGALPMDVLESRMKAWIADAKTVKSAAK